MGQNVPTVVPEPSGKVTPKQWADALRSGKYKQGKDFLLAMRIVAKLDEPLPKQEVKTYCCLGVLCDIADPSNWRSANSNIYEMMGNSSVTPEYIMIRAGLRTSMGHFNPTLEDMERLEKINPILHKRLQTYIDMQFGQGALIRGGPKMSLNDRLGLTNLNDSEQFTFEDIATIIEWQPTGLFIKE